MQQRAENNSLRAAALLTAPKQVPRVYSPPLSPLALSILHRGEITEEVKFDRFLCYLAIGNDELVRDIFSKTIFIFSSGSYVSMMNNSISSH